MPSQHLPLELSTHRSCGIRQQSCEDCIWEGQKCSWFFLVLEGDSSTRINDRNVGRKRICRLWHKNKPRTCQGWDFDHLRDSHLYQQIRKFPIFNYSFRGSKAPIWRQQILCFPLWCFWVQYWLQIHKALVHFVWYRSFDEDGEKKGLSSVTFKKT